MSESPPTESAASPISVDRVSVALDLHDLDTLHTPKFPFHSGLLWIHNTPETKFLLYPRIRVGEKEILS